MSETTDSLPDLKGAPGLRLKHARKLAGLTRGQAAKLLATNSRLITALEDGEMEIVPDAMERFAELYDVNLAWLATGDTRPLDAHWEKELEKLAPADRDNLRRLFEGPLQGR